jgi:hypothetical protein
MKVNKILNNQLTALTSHFSIKTILLFLGILVTFSMLTGLLNFTNEDGVETYIIKNNIYPKNGNREERAKWWCSSWKLNDNKCQTWIKTFSEVEDPYFDLDPAEFLNRSPDEFLIFQLY